MAFPILGAVAGAGALANFLGGRSASRKQNDLMGAQRRLINQQAQSYAATQPYYLQTLQQLAANAGLNQSPGVMQRGTNHFALGASAGDDRGEFGLGGGYGSRGTQLRLRAAEDDIGRLAALRGGNLGAQLARRGVAQGTQAAALAGNQRAAQQDYSRFRRGLAIEEDANQQQRMAQLLAALGQGFGQGSAAVGGYGQQAGIYGQQANQAFGGLGQIVQDYSQQQALQDYLKKRNLQNWWDEDPVFGI